MLGLGLELGNPGARTMAIGARLVFPNLLKYIGIAKSAGYFTEGYQIP